MRRNTVLIDIRQVGGWAGPHMCVHYLWRRMTDLFVVLDGLFIFKICNAFNVIQVG